MNCAGIWGHLVSKLIQFLNFVIKLLKNMRHLAGQSQKMVDFSSLAERVRNASMCHMDQIRDIAWSKVENNAKARECRRGEACFAGFASTLPLASIQAALHPFESLKQTRL